MVISVMEGCKSKEGIWIVSEDGVGILNRVVREGLNKKEIPHSGKAKR